MEREGELPLATLGKWTPSSGDTMVDAQGEGEGEASIPGLQSLTAALRRAVDGACTGWLAQHRDDVFQAGYIRLHNALGKGRGVNKAYVKRVAYTAMVDEIRRLKRLPQGECVEEQRVESPGETPEADSIRGRIRRAIGRCLGHLEAGRRRALVLYLQGHSVPEAAKLMGFTPKKAENLVYRGRREVQDCLRRQGIDSEVS